jgi:hemoglobin
MSLHAELGGDEAIALALDRFYEKVLADARVSGYFDGLDLERLKSRQRDFLAMAFGGPDRYDGRDLRAAHARPRQLGLDDQDYDVFMGHFHDTLAELGVPGDKIQEVMAIAHTARTTSSAVEERYPIAGSPKRSRAVQGGDPHHGRRLAEHDPASRWGGTWTRQGTRPPRGGSAVYRRRRLRRSRLAPGRRR